MTKKELLDNDIFKALPDDAEILFGTDARLDRCVALNALNLSAMQQSVNIDAWKDIPTNIRDGFRFEPKIKTVLLIDAVPYWYLKEKYNITVEQHEE